MYRFPFYSSPTKGKNIPTRPVKYISEDNGTKLKIVEVAKDIGIRKAAKLFNKAPATVWNDSWYESDVEMVMDPLVDLL